MNFKRHAAKARAYHRKRCQHWQRRNGVWVWRFIYNPGADPILSSVFFVK